MGNLYNNSDPFENFGQRPLFSAKRFIDGTHGDALVTGGLFTVTNVASTTVSQNNIGGRPCYQFTNTNTTATDGVQFQGVAASILLQPGKEFRMLGAFQSDTTTQEWSFGIGAMDTSIIASASTDYLKVEKLTGATAPSFKARKASGTEVTWPSPATILANTWYDFEFTVRLDLTTAGKGVVSFSGTNSVLAGGVMGNNFSALIATQFPDTVLLSPFMAWRAGSTANVNGYVSHLGWCMQG